MPGDFSRITFNKKKHYSGVLMQQGRVQLDADWNEQLEIEQHKIVSQTTDIIGLSGVPKNGNSFKISFASNNEELLINPGRIYVEGLLCEMEERATYFNQPYYPNPDQSYFDSGRFRPIDGARVDRLPLSFLNLQDGLYIVYIDAWQREVSYLDDSLIKEVALGEADTATRLQNVWQVKLMQTKNRTPLSNSEFAEWSNLTERSKGKLNVQTRLTEDRISACALSPNSGYQRLENQLYRVEVQKATGSEYTFKWSRDNASVETKIENIEGSILTVSTTGKDAYLSFNVGQWVEVVDEESALNNKPRQLSQVMLVDRSAKKITLSTSDLPDIRNGKLKLRRWDQTGSTAGPDGVQITEDWVELEDGIQVMFSGGTYQAGDYWLIPARTTTGDVEWPPYGIPNVSPSPQFPLGINHKYCKLALLQVQSGRMNLVDSRPLFPTLTEICAEDICYKSSSRNGLDASTVQQALDQLSRKHDSPCTFLVAPEQGWERVFDQIRPGQDAEVCFQTGEYPLKQAVDITDKGHIKLTGAGPGTRILSLTSRAALVFSKCKTVIVRDIYAESGLAVSDRRILRSNLNGTLSFVDCTVVEISKVFLKCSADGTRATSCIYVRNNVNISCTVTIQNTNLTVGHLQQGILLINVLQSFVENNTIEVHDTEERLIWERILKDKRALANLRQIMVSTIYVGEKPPAHGRFNVSLKHGRTTVCFLTERSLQRAWKKVFDENPLLNARSERDVVSYLKRLADRILLDVSFRNKYKPFRDLVESTFNEQRRVAEQGITIAGSIGKEIRILNNTIRGCLQGIHVGITADDVRGITDPVNGVTILNNAVSITLPGYTGKMERHGIFVGNCKCLILENNNIELERLEGSDNIGIDGIKAWGKFGNQLIITKNRVSGKDGSQKKSFTIGINVNPLQARSSIAQWLIMYNVALGKQSSIRAVNGAIALAGTNAGH